MRLIDADKLPLSDIDSANYGSNYIRLAPTVEAIQKADYEARLKADMVAMLEQLDLEIQEQIAFMGDGEEANGMKRADYLIKDKINTLKQSIRQEYYNGPKEVEQ